MRKKEINNSLDSILQDELMDPEFAKAWAETELEDQIKRAVIASRIEKGLTQAQLSELSGIRQSNISRIENGTATPTLKTLNAIACGTGKS